MLKTKSYSGIAVLVVSALLVGACAGAPVSEVRSAADARDAALTYLREHEAQNAPSPGIEWQEEDVTPPGLVGAVTKEFLSDEWTVKVSYAVLPPQRTAYRVVVSSIKLGWHWNGSVKADGIVTEVSAFKQMSEEESQKTAEEFLRNGPTFVFDGIGETLRLTDTLTARCPYCWVFVFEFDSRHAGYGDRTGQVLAQVITPHRAVIAVEQLEITSAVMDDKWDMLSQEILQELEIRLAPIHEVQVNIAESYPPQVFVYIKGGLTDGCTTFHELTTERSGNTVDIRVTTQRPYRAVCAQVYGFFEKNVNLGTDFASGETYTLNVNDKTTSLVMQ